MAFLSGKDVFAFVPTVFGKSLSNATAHCSSTRSGDASLVSPPRQGCTILAKHAIHNVKSVWNATNSS